MPRYIDADRFKQVLADLYDYAKWDPRELHFSLFDMIGNIDGEPTADVAPVAHAHWVEKTFTFECSACCGDAINNYAYCPRCGAKMDERNQE